MGHCCFLSFCCCNLSISCDMQYLYYIRALSRYNCNKIQFRIKLLLLSKQFCSSVLVGNIKKTLNGIKKNAKRLTILQLKVLPSTPIALEKGQKVQKVQQIGKSATQKSQSCQKCMDKSELYTREFVTKTKVEMVFCYQNCSYRV